VIVTEALVEVEEVLVGGAPAMITVRTYGGEVAGYRVEAHGFPRFEEGERAVLFLTAAEDGTTRVLGYQLGHYRIGRNRAGVEVAVPSVDAGGSYLTRDGRVAPRPETQELVRFKADVRRVARALGRETDAR
jgi:hypothetical protein